MSITNSQSFLKLMSIKSVIPFNQLILCHPLPLLTSIFPIIRVFPNELVLRIRWPKYWSFSFSISPSNDYSWLISFRIDWLDLQSSPTHFKSINSLVLRYLYGHTLTSVHNCQKNHSFDNMDFFSKVMSLPFNMLSRCVIAFLPRSKRLLISWLQSPSAVILEPK